MKVNSKLKIYYPIRRNINGWHRHTSKPPTLLPYPWYQRNSSAPTDRCPEGRRHERRLDRNRKLRVKSLWYTGYYTISTSSKLALCLGAKIVKSAMTRGGKCRSTLSSKYGMTVSSFPFKESESSLFTSVAWNVRPTCANPPPTSLHQCSVFLIL